MHLGLCKLLLVPAELLALRRAPRLCWARGIASASAPAHLGFPAFHGRPRSSGAILMAEAAPVRARGAATTSRKDAVLVLNGEPGPADMSKDMLLKKYSGAYTTARTVDQTSIFEFSMHCRRLAQTLGTILQEEASSDWSSADQAREFFRDEEEGARSLKPLVTSEIAFALDRLGNDGSGREYQVTVLLTCESVGAHTPSGRGFDIHTFVQPMPSFAPMVEVLASQAKRNNPTIKDVQWVLDRQQLEELQRQAGVNELIMFDDDGFITEGLQTNFFAVNADGAVLTAPEDRVLSGTVRKVVLEVMEKHGIPWRPECPNIKEFASWDSCFICSTSRLVKPISKIQVPDLDARRDFPDDASVAHKLEELVRDAIRENSERLF